MAVLRLAYAAANVTVRNCFVGGLNGFDSDAAALEAGVLPSLWEWMQGGRDLVVWRGFAKDLRCAGGDGGRGWK